jgi:hypothetical protein
MSKIDSWSGNSWPLGAWIDDHDLGVDTAILIADKSTSIVVIRAGAAQAAQTVRIETLAGQGKTQTMGGVVHSIDGLLIGYKGHPTITDTSIQAGDRFKVGAQMFEVISIMPGLVDSVQAYLSAKA